MTTTNTTPAAEPQPEPETITVEQAAMRAADALKAARSNICQCGMCKEASRLEARIIAGAFAPLQAQLAERDATIQSQAERIVRLEARMAEIIRTVLPNPVTFGGDPERTTIIFQVPFGKMRDLCNDAGAKAFLDRLQAAEARVKDLESAAEKEDYSHGITIDQRDAHEDSLDSIFVELEMSEDEREWSSSNDPVVGALAIIETFKSTIATQAAELERLRSAPEISGKRELAERLLAEHGLPLPGALDAWWRVMVSDAFFEALLSAGDEKQVRRLVEERSLLVWAVAPNLRYPTRSPRM